MYVNVCLSHWGPILAPHLGAAHSGGWSVSHAEDSQSGHTETPPTPSPTVTEGSLGAEPRSLWARPSRSPGSVKVTAWTGGRPSRGVFRPHPTMPDVTHSHPSSPRTSTQPQEARAAPQGGLWQRTFFPCAGREAALRREGTSRLCEEEPEALGETAGPPPLSADHQRHFQIAPKHTIVLFLLSGKTTQGVSQESLCGTQSVKYTPQTQQWARVCWTWQAEPPREARVRLPAAPDSQVPPCTPAAPAGSLRQEVCKSELNEERKCSLRYSGAEAGRL